MARSNPEGAWCQSPAYPHLRDVLSGAETPDNIGAGAGFGALEIPSTAGSRQESIALVVLKELLIARTTRGITAVATILAVNPPKPKMAGIILRCSAGAGLKPRPGANRGDCGGGAVGGLAAGGWA